MVDLAFLQPISWFAASIGVLVAAGYYIFTARTTLQTRQTQLFMQVMDKMDQQWLDDYWEVMRKWEWENYDDFIEKYGPDNNTKFREVFGHLMHVGILVQGGFLDPGMISYWMGSQIVSLWMKYEAIVYEYRRRNEPAGRGTFLEYVEDLAIAVERVRVDGARLEKRVSDRRAARKSIGWSVPK